MTGFNHVLTGIAIAVTVRNPVLAPVLAFVSHFVLDAIPHADYAPWGKKILRPLIVDATLSSLFLILSIVLFPNLWWLLLLCMFAATLPDWLWILHFGFGVQHWFFRFHKKIQWSEKPWGMFVEVFFAIMMCVVIGLVAYKLY